MKEYYKVSAVLKGQEWNLGIKTYRSFTRARIAAGLLKRRFGNALFLTLIRNKTGYEIIQAIDI